MTTAFRGHPRKISFELNVRRLCFCYSAKKSVFLLFWWRC